LSAELLVQSCLVFCEKMGYLSKGYYTICLSSILSSTLHLTMSLIFMGRFSLAMSLGLNISIIGIQVCGIALCFVGWRKHDTIETLVGYKRISPLSFDIRLSVPLTVILVLWGSWVVYLAWFTVFSGQPHEKLLWMKDPVALTSFAAWALKGIIGTVSGLVFTAISYVRKPSKSKPEIKLA